MCVVVVPTDWVAICDICGYESAHSFESGAEEAIREHIDEGCGYR